MDISFPALTPYEGDEGEPDLPGRAHVLGPTSWSLRAGHGSLQRCQREEKPRTATQRHRPPGNQVPLLLGAGQDSCPHSRPYPVGNPPRPVEGSQWVERPRA